MSNRLIGNFTLSERLDLSHFVKMTVQIAVFIVICLLVIVPLATVVVTSITPPESLPFSGGGETLQNYYEMFTRNGTAKLLINTLRYALATVAVGVGIAMVLAWLTERTDISGKVVFRTLMYSWMAVPPLVFGYGWILLINPGNGAINVLLSSLIGDGYTPMTPYSLAALILISGLSVVPTAYIMISGVLRNMDPSLEDVSVVHGATPLKTIRKITLPLIAPGLLSVSLYLIMGMVQTFDLPLILGTTAQYPVLSTRIFLLASPDGGRPSYGLAAAFGVGLILMATVLLFGYFWLTRFGERYRVMSGKGFRQKRTSLGRWKPVGYGILITYFMVMLMPLAMLLWSSLFSYFRLPSFGALQDINLDAYRRVLTEPTLLRAFSNSVKLVVVCSLSVLFLSCLVSWFSVRSGGVFSKLLDALAFLPMAIPGIVLAVAFLLIFIGTPLYGTIWVLVLGHMTTYLAFGTRTMHGVLLQIHQDLEDAALVCGASWRVSMQHIVIPLIKPHLLNVWLWVLCHSARDLTFPLILMTSSNVVISSAIYLTWDYPDQQAAAAIAMLMVGVLMLFVIPVQVYIGRHEKGRM